MTTSTEQESAVGTSAPALTPVLSKRFALQLKHVFVTGLFGALLLVLNYLPLRSTDLWGHVIYGNWILDHRWLPAEDPSMPLAEGMRVVDSAWLAQVIFAQVEAWGGAQWLSNLFALTVWATLLVLTRVFYLQSRNIGLAAAGTMLVLAVGWSRVTTIRPEIFAMLCFAVLLWLLVGSRSRGRVGLQDPPSSTEPWPWRLWVGVPMLFWLWANLHGSFFCGLAVLVCFWLGRLIEVAWYSRSLQSVRGDCDARRWLCLTELAAAATLINPYGIDLWINTFGFASNANLGNVTEWAPWVIIGTGGWSFALACVLLVVVLRHSRHAMRPVDVLLLVVFAGLAVRSIRMLGWFAPVFVLVLMPHLDDLLRRLRPARRDPTDEASPEIGPTSLPRGQSWRYSLCCVALAWITFAFSGLSQPLLGGATRSPQGLHDEETPLALTEYLRANPPSGQIYNPQWWGDWLAWAGPEGLKPFVTTHIHLVPARVWQDYRQISRAQPGWQRALDRYRVTTTIVDKQAQPLLAAAVRRDPNWTVNYEDDQALLAVRSTAAPAAVRSTKKINSNAQTRQTQ